jgi:hypothetical protein
MQHGRIAAQRQQHFRRITFLVAPRTYAIDSDAICADLVTQIVCACAFEADGAKPVNPAGCGEESLGASTETARITVWKRNAPEPPPHGGGAPPSVVM